MKITASNHSRPSDKLWKESERKDEKITQLEQELRAKDHKLKWTENQSAERRNQRSGVQMLTNGKRR